MRVPLPLPLVLLKGPPSILARSSMTINPNPFCGQFLAFNLLHI